MVRVKDQKNLLTASCLLQALISPGFSELRVAIEVVSGKRVMKQDLEKEVQPLWEMLDKIGDEHLGKAL